MKAEYVAPTIFVLFVVLFFGRIISNGIQHEKYKVEFTKQCEAKGGIVRIPRGVKGWPIATCVNPEMIIDVDVKL